MAAKLILTLDCSYEDFKDFLFWIDASIRHATAQQPIVECWMFPHALPIKVCPLQNDLHNGTVFVQVDEGG
jgi:hypothetical protein